MKIYTNLQFAFNGKSDDIKKAVDVVTTITNEKLSSDNKITDTLCISGVPSLETMAVAMVNAAPEVEFDIDGMFDSSESSGEYMDFKIVYKDGILKGKYSDWYVEDEKPNMGNFKKIKTDAKSLDEMKEELVEFFELMDYEDFDNRVLSKMTDKEIEAFYKQTVIDRDIDFEKIDAQYAE